MKSCLRTLGLISAVLFMVAGLTVFSYAKDGTFTGTISDAMCGVKHAMPGDAASCTRDCVGKGSKFALVVGDKVYVLDTSDKAALATLDKQAGAKATVTGSEKDGTITVKSVKAVQ